MYSLEILEKFIIVHLREERICSFYKNIVKLLSTKKLV